MHFEYKMLAVMTLLFFFAWIPTSVGKFYSFGAKWLASNRNPPKDNKELLPWAARCERAYSNLKDFFPAYAVTILVLGAVGKFDETTQWASGIFIIGRVMHYIFYGMGNVNMRFLSFVVAMGSNVVLFYKIFV